MQKTSFPIEIIVHDDASTDGTRDVIREFEGKYHELFRVTYETENKYSHGFKGKMDTEFGYKLARGKYIAYCEGDDYWTDQHKLQKQFDFMEAHPEYSVCFHGFHRIRGNVDASYNSIADDKRMDDYGVVDITARDFLNDKCNALPLTMFFRASMYNVDWAYKYKSYRDTHQIYLLLRNGKGAYMSFDGAVHVKHEGGVYTSQTELVHALEAVDCFAGLYRKNRDDKDLKKRVADVMLWCYDVSCKNDAKNEFYKKALKRLFVIPRITIAVLCKIIYK